MQPYKFVSQSLRYLPQLCSSLCKYTLTNTNQFGFHSNHSTEQALISLIKTIKKSLDNDEIVCRVFIVLQKAFDTVNHEILLEKVNHYGKRSKENNWLCSNRKQYVSLNGFFSQTKIVPCGISQGSTLGPLLFLMYINDFNNAIDKCIVQHFADGTSLFFVSKCPSEISCVMNNELQLPTDWLRANKISMNGSKTKLSILRPRKKLSITEPNIKLNNFILTPERTITYLGIEIYENLSWSNK